MNEFWVNIEQILNEFGINLECVNEHWTVSIHSEWILDLDWILNKFKWIRMNWNELEWIEMNLEFWNET